MTKEIKEAEAKKLKDLKEQRRQYKAVGLKAGHVMEECSIPAVGAGSAGFGASDGNAGGDGGDVGRGGLLSDKHSWRQLTTAEILQQARPQMVFVEGSQHQKGGLSTSVSEGGPASHEQAAGVGTRTSAAVRSTGESVTKRKGPVSDGDDVLRGGTKAKEGGNAAKVKRSRLTKERKDDQYMQCKQEAPAKKKDAGKHKTHGVAAIDEPVRSTECEFAGCPKMAKFGVNGTVRYW